MSILSIKASDIDNWTSKEPRRAQELLPKLVWKLILASTNYIEDHHFPFEKAVQYAGYDGYLITSDTNSFYPSGTSVWEFGTDEDIKSKFNSDYQKRSENSNGIETKETTFCFVTSRIWNHREGITEFTTSKQSDGIWKNVRILDANNLELWLNECPSVAIWFSKVIEKPYNNVILLEDYWNSIVEKTEPKLTTEFMCYGRSESIADDIIKYVEDGCSQIIISAESKIEAVLTLAGDLLNDSNTKKQQILERCVVALTSEGLNNIRQYFNNAIIIPIFKTEALSPLDNNVLIFPTENKGPVDLLFKNSPKASVLLRRRKVFTKALECLGYETNDADRIAGDVKCRFSPFLRKITNDIQIKLPAWVSNANVSNLIPALLANAWEANYQGDRTAIEILSGQKYEDYITSLLEYTQGDNMPIFRLDNSFACVSINEMWDVLARHINNDFFDNYKKCIKYVFEEVDPKYELSEDKWYAASVYGKQSQFSDRLKRGLIISMTKLVELDEKEGFFNFATNCTSDCNSLVFDIYSNIKSANQWRTLVSYVPDFAEATPDIMLRILEQNVAENSENFWSLFKSSIEPLFGNNFYTYILWALEKLIWIKACSVRSINLLIAIDEKNFEYRISNCPLDSLVKTFCLWYHQGALSIDERNLLLVNIIEKHHTLGRKLINKLLPSGTSSITNLSEFHWKYVECCEPSVTTDQYNQSIILICNKFVETIDSSLEDWCTIIKHFSLFYNIFIELNIDIHKKVLELCEADRLTLCKKIASYISRKRKFGNKSDGDDKSLISEMEQLYHVLLPNSALKYAHYYSHDFYGLNPTAYGTDEYDYDKEHEELKKIRLVALEKTLDDYGIDSIIVLSQNVNDLNLLIDAFVDSKYCTNIDVNFIVKTHSEFSLFAEELVRTIYHSKGLSFFVNNSNKFSENEIKWIVCKLPMKPDVIEFVNTFSESVQNSFWKNANTWGIMHCEDEFAQDCIVNLLKYNRPFSAIRELYFSTSINADLAVNVLQSALEYHPKTEENGINLNSIQSYYIEGIFEKIYDSPSIDTMKIAQLELVYLNKFDIDFEPKCLIQEVLDNPSVYMELITGCFKKDDAINNEDSNNDDDVDIEDSEQKEYRISLFFKALDRIKRLPGQNGDNINVNKFNSWIKSVLDLAKELNYLRACEIQIGTLLSYSPKDEDGVWPHRCVRDFIEHHSTKLINDHICMGIHNQRGVYTVTGGDEEERIATTYSEYAEKLQLLYPKTAIVLKQISDSYKTEARYEKNRELKGYF